MPRACRCVCAWLCDTRLLGCHSSCTSVREHYTRRTLTDRGMIRQNVPASSLQGIFSPKPKHRWLARDKGECRMAEENVIVSREIDFCRFSPAPGQFRASLFIADTCKIIIIIIFFVRDSSSNLSPKFWNVEFHLCSIRKEPFAGIVRRLPI